MNFNIEEKYEMDTIGTDNLSATSTYTLLPNFVGKSESYATSWLRSNGVSYEIKENINDTNNIRDINEMKTTMYSSLTNKFYNNFYWNEINNNNPYRNSTIISGTDNIFYNIYTNTKNYITENNAPIGYELMKEEKKRTADTPS